MINSTFKYIFYIVLILIIDINSLFATTSLNTNSHGVEIAEESTLNVSTFNATISVSSSECVNSDQNPQITFKASGGISPYTFKYRINEENIDSIVSDYLSSTAILSLSTGKTGVFTCKLLSVTDNSGVSMNLNDSATFEIYELPDLTFNTTAEKCIEDGKIFLKVCSNKPVDLTFTNTSTTISENESYLINWGDGSEEFSAKTWSSLSHNYEIGIWKLTYTIVSKYGCSNSKTFDVYIGSNPAVSLGSPGNTDNCSDTPLTFPITGTENNPPGTTYTVSFNDGSPSQTYVHPPPAEITHVFSSTSCGVTSYNGTSPYPNSFSASIVATNMCGVTAVNVVPIYISTAPVVDFKTPAEKVGLNKSVTITNATTGYVNEGANCQIVPKLVWIITPDTGFTLSEGLLGNDFGQDNSNLWIKGTDVIKPIFNVPGTYTIKLRVDTKRCGDDQIEKTICVEAPLKPEFVLDQTIGCSPVETVATNNTDLTETCSSTIDWSVTYKDDLNLNTTPVWSYINSTNSKSENPFFKFETPGVYTVKLIMKNSSGTFYSDQKVVVQRKPVFSIENIEDYCGLSIVNPVAKLIESTSIPACEKYLWSFPGGIPETSTTLNPGAIRYDIPGEYTATLTLENSCGSATVVSNTFKINPIPFVNSISNQIKNNGQFNDEIVLSGSENTVFEWFNSTPAIGLNESGKGSILPAKLINEGNTVISAEISVVPKSPLTGCEGDTLKFKITVNPEGNLNSVEDMIVSNGDKIPEIMFTTNTVGGNMSYIWSNNLPDIGLSGSGTGNINSFTAINENNEPLVASISVTPVFEFAGVQNTGETKTFNITVLPTAQVNVPENIELCNGIKTSEIVFETTNLQGITTYNWVNDNPTIGLNESGEGDILSFNVINIDTLSSTATVTVTPTYTFGEVQNTGKSVQFKIKVNPGAAIVSQPKSSFVCPGGVVEPLKVEYENGAGIPIYQWYSNKLNTNSGGNLIKGANKNTYLPSSEVSGITYYYCTITLPNGICSDLVSDVATIEINDAASISKQLISTQNICVGGTIDTPLSIEYTGGSGTATFQWYKSSSNNIANAEKIVDAIDSVYTPPVFTEAGKYYYFVELTLSGDGCGSLMSETAEVNVAPDPVIEIQPVHSQQICKDVIPEMLTVGSSGGLGTFNYQWFVNTVNNNISGTLIPQATENSYLPPANSIGKSYYYCEVSQPNGLSCGVTSETSELIVSPKPVIVSQPLSATLCYNEIPDSLKVSYQYGVGAASYQWYSNTTNSTNSGTIIPGSTNQSFLPTGLSVGESYFYCEISFKTGGISKIVSNVATLTLLPVPIVKSKEITVSNGTEVLIKPENQNGDIVPDGTTYTWIEPNGSTPNSISGMTAQNTPVSQFKQKLLNQTDSLTTITYTLVPYSGSCVGNSFEIKINVAPSLVVNAEVLNSNCFGVNNGSIKLDIKGGLPVNKLKPYNIYWTGPSGFTSDSGIISNLYPGSYNVIISDGVGSTATYFYTITEPEEMKINVVSKTDVDCHGNNNGQISINVDGGTPDFSYMWTKDGVAFATTKDLKNIVAGKYMVEVTDAINCSAKSASFIISEPDGLEIKLIDKKDVGCYSDNSGAISIAVTGGSLIEVAADEFDYTYLWTGPNHFESTSKNLTNLSAGKYDLVVTDKNDCSSHFSTIISEPRELILTASSTPVTCYNAKDATITLNISGGTEPYQIQWSNFGSGEKQENLSPGEYFAVVTDGHNCQKSVSVIVNEANFFIHPVVNNVSCHGANDGSINLNVSGGLQPISLAWEDNPSAGSVRNKLAAGIYKVTLFDGAPCNITQTFIITEPEQINIAAKIKNAFDCGNTSSGSIDLSISGGRLPYQIQWSNGSKTEDLHNIPAGFYSVEVTDSVGCSSIAQFEILRQKEMSLNVDTKSDFDCETGELVMKCSVKVNGGVAPYSYYWSSGKVKSDNAAIMETGQSGIITVVVTDSLDCNIEKSFTVDLPQFGIEYSLIDCNKFSYQFVGIQSNVDAFKYSYNWNFGDGTVTTEINPEHNFNAAGIYNVQLKVSNGNCESTYEEAIVVNSKSVLKLDKEPKYCPGESTVLHVTGAQSYIWSDGTVGDSCEINKSADFSVIGITTAGCRDTLYFTTSICDLLNYTIQSENNEIVPDGTETHLWSDYVPYSAYYWDFGDGSVGRGDNVYHVFKVNEQGYYDIKLKVINPSGCTEETATKLWLTIPELPNTFSPNGDGINDYFLPEWELKVYSRIGTVLYEGNTGWDGKHNGRPVAEDIYYYVVYYQTEAGTKTKPGYVRVIR